MSSAGGFRAGELCGAHRAQGKLEPRAARRKIHTGARRSCDYDNSGKSR